MPPKKARAQPARQAHRASQPVITKEVIAKRTRRHLDELERTNYAEPSISYFEEEGDGGGKYAKGKARQTVSDKRNVLGGAAGKKKKSSMNVRTALLYRKNLNTLIEESGISRLPPQIPTYLTALTPPREIPIVLCSVCGYWGRYKCKRCAMPYCDMGCEGVHAETRCERRVI